jgi:hypothetical protein
MAEKVFRECGEGWESLIAPLEEEVERLGGMVQQIKEKFGTLVFYFSEPVAVFEESTENAWDNLEMMVAAAETASRTTCEMCGKPGKLRTSGRWLKTLCDEDALLQGYKESK